MECKSYVIPGLFLKGDSPPAVLKNEELISSSCFPILLWNSFTSFFAHWSRVSMASQYFTQCLQLSPASNRGFTITEFIPLSVSKKSYLRTFVCSHFSQAGIRDNFPYIGTLWHYYLPLYFQIRKFDGIWYSFSAPPTSYLNKSYYWVFKLEMFLKLLPYPYTLLNLSAFLHHHYLILVTDLVCSVLRKRWITEILTSPMERIIVKSHLPKG